MSNANLYKNLQTVKSEEDVKDIYIKALGLKGYNAGNTAKGSYEERCND